MAESMFTEFQASYQRVEASLQCLTDSIAAYNPSPTAADELVTADAVVTEKLHRLVTHQQNHLRLQLLRQIAASLDDTLRNTFTLLATTRRELQAIPPRAPATFSREVNVDQLLAYAKFISPTTVPPTFRRAVPPLASEKATPEAPGTNGIHTPAASNGDNTAAATPGVNAAVQAVDAVGRAWLDPAANLPFEPWPSHGVVQRSALMEIQRMVESGVDPAAVLSAEEREAVERRRREEEERERVELEEEERRARMLFESRRGVVGPEEEVFNPDDL